MKPRIHKLLSLTLLMGYSLGLWAQAPAETATGPSPAAFEVSHIMTWVIGIVAMLLLAFGLFSIAKANRMLAKRLLQLEAARLGITLPDEEAAATAAASVSTRRKGPVPIEREAEIMSSHSYDGIRELDNRLPSWWVNMFLVSIVFAIGYIYYYHLGGNGPSSSEEYETELAVAEKNASRAAASETGSVDEKTVTALTDAPDLGEGELIFKNSCAACHGMHGEGSVGPNLTDGYWLHGGGIKHIFHTIKFGVPEKGMIAWQSQLKPTDIQKVASYILTLKGTNPANPKAPQGEIWNESADSTAAPATTPPAEGGK